MLTKKLVIIFMLMFITVVVNAQITFSDLKGTWRYSSYEGSIDLVFQSENQLILGGEPANYSLVRNAIRVQDEYYPVDYPLTLKGDTLNISFPEGYQLDFIKVEGTGQDNIRGTQQNQTYDQQHRQTQGNQAGGQEYQLQGKLCCYSGSSSSSSSYSSTKWAYFDGRGNFQYGSESSFSSDAGITYGGENNNEKRGTYRVSGNNVTLTYSDGSSDTAKVETRLNDGSITVLKYAEELYAKQLCD